MGIEIARYALAGAPDERRRPRAIRAFRFPAERVCARAAGARKGCCGCSKTCSGGRRGPRQSRRLCRARQGGAQLGRARRIVATLKTMDEGETLVIQSGKPIGVIKTHATAPLVIMANCNIVGQWAKARVLRTGEERPDLLGRPDGRRLAIYRQPGRHPRHLRDLHARRRASLRRRSRRPFRSHRRARRHGRLAAARRADGRERRSSASKSIPSGRAKRQAIGYLEEIAPDLDGALAMIAKACAARSRRSRSALVANAAEVYPELVRRGVTPDVVTDQTAAHDLVYGYVPRAFTLEETRALRKSDPNA